MRGESGVAELNILSLFLILHAWAKKSAPTKTDSPEVSSATPNAKEPRSPAAGRRTDPQRARDGSSSPLGSGRVEPTLEQPCEAGKYERQQADDKEGRKEERVQQQAPTADEWVE